MSFLIQQGLQQQFQDSDGDGIRDYWDKEPHQPNLGKEREKYDRLVDIRNAHNEEQKQFQERAKTVKEVAGTLVAEYYPDKKEFAKNHSLVKEIQADLVELGYNLGTSGKEKNGVDGDLGGETIQAMHSFEIDNPEAIKVAREIQNTIHGGQGESPETIRKKADLQVLSEILHSYSEWGISKQEKEELKQISAFFGQMGVGEIENKREPFGAIIPGEMTVKNPGGNVVGQEYYFGAPQKWQEWLGGKSDLLAKVLSDYSKEGLTEHEKEVITRLSTIMKVKNPISEGVSK